MGWEADLDAAWAAFSTIEPEDFLARITSIVSAPGVPDAVAQFEIGGVHDSLGQPELAVPAYRRALELGLDQSRARQATIQLASTLRNLGRPEEGLALLTALGTADDGLDDAIAVFRALILVDLDDSRSAVATLIHSLAEHLPRYRLSAHRYADALITQAP